MKKVEEGWQNNSRWGKKQNELVLMNFFIRAICFYFIFKAIILLKIIHF